MSNGEVKKVSPQDLQLVQNLIERCLQLYMTQKEVVSTLLHQAKIEPSFTELVWQKLEEENQDFFKAYHLRLILKDQILKFNKLLQTQAELMSQISPATSATSVPINNGSHVSLVHQNSSYHTSDNTQSMKLESMHQSAAAKLPGGLTNGASSLHPSMQSGVSMSTLPRRDDVSPSVLMNQNSNMGMIHGMNGEGIIKSESGYAEEPAFMFNPANNVLERHPVMPEVPVASFIGEESNAKTVNEPIVDPDAPSFGFLGQIPRNFSLSDLTADFNISSDILDNYSRSPYLAADTDFLNPNGNGDIQGRHSAHHIDRTFGK
ncbi:putative angiotensin-converting enzyme 2 [Helianthus anomalus]